MNLEDASHVSKAHETDYWQSFLTCPQYRQGTIPMTVQIWKEPARTMMLAGEKDEPFGQSPDTVHVDKHCAGKRAQSLVPSSQCYVVSWTWGQAKVLTAGWQWCSNREATRYTGQAFRPLATQWTRQPRHPLPDLTSPAWPVLTTQRIHPSSSSWSAALPVWPSQTLPSPPPWFWLSTPGMSKRWSFLPWRALPLAALAPASSSSALVWCSRRCADPSCCPPGWWGHWGRSVAPPVSISLGCSPSCRGCRWRSTWEWRPCRGRRGVASGRSPLDQPCPTELVPPEGKTDKTQFLIWKAHNLAFYMHASVLTWCNSLSLYSVEKWLLQQGPWGWSSKKEHEPFWHHCHCVTEWLCMLAVVSVEITQYVFKKSREKKPMSVSCTCVAMREMSVSGSCNKPNRLLCINCPNVNPAVHLPLWCTRMTMAVSLPHW